MEFIPAIDTFPSDTEANFVKEQLWAALQEIDGLCFYKHPSLGSNGAETAPDFAVLGRGFQPVVVRCVRASLEEIQAVRDDFWEVRSHKVDSPLLEVEDLTENLRHRFHRERPLRESLEPIGIVALPNITKREFTQRFGRDLPSTTLWQDSDASSILSMHRLELDEVRWKLARSVFQAASVLNRRLSFPVDERSPTLGGAIQMLDKQIALLDIQQLKGAVQIAPGPQRIRGLAGTGKTVLLAMKAAAVHGLYPEKTILFTFHTQSLYNQAQRLITRFYRVNNEVDPDWTKLHIRHAWGSRAQRGVYRETTLAIGDRPLDLQAARDRDASMPFRACCQQLLAHTIKPEYDFILVDEGQDLPAEYFQVLYQLSHPPHRIYFAYDELQNLTAVQLPDPSDLFGKDENGHPLVTLEGEYPAGMDKDLVLYRSYRCPQDVLMLAHGIGLGLKGPRGCVQMLPDRASWESIGYVVEEGRFQTNDEMVIRRPAENSPNPVHHIYTGNQALTVTHVFNSREDEIAWAIESLVNDIRHENVRPEDIILIWFESRYARKVLPRIQQGLLEQGIASTVPGLSHQTSDFAEEGRVTLTTPFRAKGNECPIVYLMASEVLHTFAGEIEYRNRAFTCISRSKGWVRISGLGSRMHGLKTEIDSLQEEFPYFRFAFPDMERIRRLGEAETTRRRKTVRKVQESIRRLLDVEQSALEDIDSEELAQLTDKLRELQDEDEAE